MTPIHLLTGLPWRWSRGIRRRARRIWRISQRRDAASIERLAARFARECLAAAPDVDAERCVRWSGVLRAFGFAAEASTLAAAPSPRTRQPLPSSRVVRLDRLCAQLQRVLARVRFLFENNLQSLPAAIHRTDARLVAVRDWAQDLPAKARVADLGCGSGRFLHALQNERPTLQWTGVDVAAAMMTSLPARSCGIVGSLLNLPIVDSAFDAVFSIEALEHALRPAFAVTEMLRVLRPGGRLLIVDKHQRFQSDCDHEPWERWFELDEVAAWLAPSARVDRCECLHADGDDVPVGLFCVWTAVKHG